MVVVGMQIKTCTRRKAVVMQTNLFPASCPVASCCLPCLSVLSTPLRSALALFMYTYTPFRFTQFVVVMFLLLFVVESVAQVVGVLVKVGKPRENNALKNSWALCCRVPSS